MRAWAHRERVIALAVIATVVTAPVSAPCQVVVERVAGSGDLGPTGLPQSQVLAPAEGPTREVVFTSRLAGVFRRAGAGVALAIGPGTAVPDGIVAGTGEAEIDEASCVVVAAALVGGAEGVYRVCPSTTTRVVGTGDVVEGGGVIRRLDFASLRAAAGFVAFMARLDDGADAVLRSDGAAIVEITRAGAPSPAGGLIATLRLAGVRADGVVGVRAAVSGGRDGLFEGDGASLTTALIEGGTTVVGLLDSIEQATLSRGGIWAFLGGLADGRGGVFRLDGTQALPLVEAVLLTGDAIPTRPGTSVRDFPGSLVPTVNAAGDVAFRAVLGGTGSGAALFATRGNAGADLVFSTRDATDVGLLSRLGDPRLADDGSLLFSATPIRGGTGVFVSRGGVVNPIASYGDPTDLGRPEIRFRFVGGRVLATAEGGALFGEHDLLVRTTAGGALESLVALGFPSPIGGEIAALGPAEIDSRGRVYFRAGVAGASRGEGIFAVTDGGIVARVVANERVKGGPLRSVVETAVELGGDLDVTQRLGSFAALVGPGGGTGGLYLLQGRRTPRLERTGKVLRGIGEIVSFGGRAAVVRRRRYAFLAAVRDGVTRDAVIARRGRRRRVVVREGPSPDGRHPGRIVGLTVPDATVHAVVTRATTDQGGAQGVVVGDWVTATVPLATGDAAVGGGVFRSFERPVLAGNRVVVAATMEEGDTTTEALVYFEASDGATAGVADAAVAARTGDTLPAGGVLHDVLGVRGTDRGAVLVRVAVRDGARRQALLRITLPGDLDPPLASQ